MIVIHRSNLWLEVGCLLNCCADLCRGRGPFNFQIGNSNGFLCLDGNLSVYPVTVTIYICECACLICQKCSFLLVSNVRCDGMRHSAFLAEW